MGLLNKAEAKRKELLDNLTKKKEKYIEHISPERKKILVSGIKKQREEILKAIGPEKEAAGPVKTVKTIKPAAASVGNMNVLSKVLIEGIEKGSHINWVEEMSLHETTIDKQHKMLLQKIDEIIEDIDSNDIRTLRGVINFLHDYFIQHFSYEEEYMQRIGYPSVQFDVHKKIHKKFAKFYDNYKKEFDNLYKTQKLNHDNLRKLMQKAKKYLGEWFVNHILTVDHKIYEFVVVNAKKSEVQNVKPDVSKLDMASLKSEIEAELKSPKAEEGVVKDVVRRVIGSDAEKGKIKPQAKNGTHVTNYIKTGVPGFDELFEQGIPRGYSVIVAGGAGSGKTIFCLQTLKYHVEQGRKCFYMSFEESEDRLRQHMNDFGWDADKLFKSGKLKIERLSPFDITRSVEAMLAKEKGELLIDIDPVIIPANFKPDVIVLDSLTAIASAFTGKEDTYRIYIEQLFRFFERLGSNSFLITETKQIPEVFSTTGVEEFLADGVIVIYNIKRGDVRENAIEVLKMRGEKHQKKIVAMQITNNGIVVYPEQEVFGGVGEDK